MKKTIWLIILLLTGGCSLFKTQYRNDLIEVYALAIPYLENDLTLDIYYGDIENVNAMTLFIPLQVVYTERLWSKEDFNLEHSWDVPDDTTRFFLTVPSGLFVEDSFSNNIDFVQYSFTVRHSWISSDQQMQSEWFMTAYGTVELNGTSHTVYRLATSEEIDTKIQTWRKDDDTAVNDLYISISTSEQYTNFITTNYYELSLRSSVDALTNFNSAYVTEETRALYEALGNKYYPLSGKINLTIDSWPVWPWTNL